MGYNMNKSAESIDRAVGERVRALREERGLSQMQLARLVGVTYQQMHKYERGINRMSAGRLQQICDALGCSVTEAMRQEPPPMTEERRRLLLLTRAIRTLSQPQVEAVAAMVRAFRPDFDLRSQPAAETA